MKYLVVVGVVWPFVLTALLFSALLAGVDVSDQMAYGALCTSPLGLPAVGVVVYRWLPAGWSEKRRVTVAGALTITLFAGELFLALATLAIGMNSLGLAPA